MGITKRRKQFLEEVVKIYQDTLLPVHYETIAEVIGVSKWTAYDVMKVLEKDGYLKSTYKKNQNDTGRSMVLFIPTEEVIKLISDNLTQISKTQKDKEIKEQLANIKDEFLHASYSKPSVKDFLKKMKNIESEVEYCYYFLGVLISYYNQVCKEDRNLTKLLTAVSDKANVQLCVFVGLVLGMITFKESDDDIDFKNISDNSYLFFEILDKINSDDLNRLVDFLNEA